MVIISKLKDGNKTIIYTDKRWVNTHHCKEHSWVDVDSKGGCKIPSAKLLIYLAITYTCTMII